MSANILDGKAVAKKCRADIKRRATLLRERGIAPTLCVVIVGDNPASRDYVDGKKRDCKRCNIDSVEIALPAETTTEELLEVVGGLNAREDIHGLLVQLPLPCRIDEKQVLNAIDPSKDVDAFHPLNVGKNMISGEGFLPCTPAGVMILLEEYGIAIEGKECVIVGRSNIVGKPMALLLLAKNGTVTVCHSRTPNLGEVTRRADILVAAAGRNDLITPDMVKPGAVVVDVAMNRREDGTRCGDCADGVADVAGWLTPVPGGVGPMTRIVLLKNTLTAAERA